MRARSILVLASAVLLGIGAFSAPSFGGDGDPEGPRQSADERASDLKARIGELEKRIGVCMGAAKEYADSGRQELAESHLRVAQALKQEAQRLRERLAGGGEGDGWRREMKEEIAKLTAAAAKAEAKSKELGANGSESEAAEVAAVAKAIRAQAAAVHAQMEARTKAERAAGAAEGAEHPAEKALPAEGLGRQERVEMRAQMERMRAEMEEMRKVVQSLREAIEGLRKGAEGK